MPEARVSSSTQFPPLLAGAFNRREPTGESDDEAEAFSVFTPKMDTTRTNDSTIDLDLSDSDDEIFSDQQTISESPKPAAVEIISTATYEKVKNRKIVCKPTIAFEVIDRRSRGGIKFKNESGLLVHSALCVFIEFIKNNGKWQVGAKFDAKEVVPALRDAFVEHFKGKRSSKLPTINHLVLCYFAVLGRIGGGGCYYANSFHLLPASFLERLCSCSRSYLNEERRAVEAHFAFSLLLCERPLLCRRLQEGTSTLLCYYPPEDGLFRTTCFYCALHLHVEC
uniref:Uncharacterized protein n=1 Tax=Palpitomonas bilix TaxID=652834 RepID=A0A7S3D6R1_9EUKA|mmetsp:Transcript_24697/g.62513  ORF Transcript_24697/g.62513 Transcript_24697/m.62513 type:complete len:281 (+) Transcript_24697:303-1145(+)